MVWQSATVRIDKNLQEIFVYNTRNPNERHLAFRKDTKLQRIEFFPEGKFAPGKMVFEGFKSIPNEFRKNRALIKGGVVYYLDKMLSGKQVKEFKVTIGGKNSFRKYNKEYKVSLNYSSLKMLSTVLSRISYEARTDRSHTADEYFHRFYPKTFKKVSVATQRMASKVINNLDEGIIPHLNSNEVGKVINFVGNLIEKKYPSGLPRAKLFSEAKIKVDEIALNDIIKEFERLLSKNTAESTWGKFLQRNLFVLDSRYVNSISELSVMLAKARKADFGLVDYNNYLDIFEIKRATTKLLALNKNRGNYYWHSDAVKAIAQAEKYLYRAERKGSMLDEDITTETGIETKNVRPRAILLIGSLTQLDNPNKLDDFRILQNSLKNVEVIPYDDLLFRLKNLKKKKILV